MAPRPRPTLSECLEGRGNNLDFLRFAAATGVIVSHSFPLGEGPQGSPEPLTVFTHGQVSLGLVCVAVFLVISGVLITRSWERTRDVRSFVLARTLRIFPGLAVSLLLTTLVLGAAFTTCPLGEYFTAPDTYRFLLRNFTLVNPQWNLPGVFEGNVYPSAVNGSLWTLMYEVGFYLLVLGLGVTGLLRKELALAGWCVTAVLSFLHIGRLGFWPVLGLYFGGGLVLYLWRERVRMSPWLAGACVLVLTATSMAGKGLPVAIGSCGAYLVLYLAFLPSRLAHFGRHGDFSYGLYIYAFPVQQTVTAMLGGPMPWWWNAALSLPVTLLLAMMSWRYIEQPAIALGKQQTRPSQPLNSKASTPGRTWSGQ
ncbi:acyltransferase [Myxococcus llanfairpwllgwyngyllgogerychwyrndrobwllllantysiliogogogochensis]|uniref:Acyltransferase n=1 Tax=Myxococcus llanfairpwllgwyngyllgogerychwyrndrobwllllantysiliogogogochensis TaxID=2590453 RepID=A0A540WUM1_9BACT|nr:acyltransferase [Myxococcus llanfairpwllgwyngyllgogerychwyrndrobwllllantysiliogogogochensis]TQF12712.1 acyltransferase [Myxococcus llanfairpwllgwyngyllgogerychwyrndrobwllllantysiliogogogochensis]